MFFLGHIALSQLILKKSYNSAHKLILILWSQISNFIFNTISLWRHDVVIFEKSVKLQASSSQIHIFIDSVSSRILSLVGFKILFLIWVKQGKYLKYSWKWDLICQKSQHHVDDVIKKGNFYHFKSIFFNLKILSKANMTSWWRHYWYDPNFLSQNIHLMPK